MKTQIDVSATGRGTVLVGSNDLSKGVRGFTLRAAVGQPVELELDLAFIEVAEIGAEDPTIVVPAGTREALIALGWTPPAESGESSADRR